MQVFLDEVTSLLLVRKKHKLTLDQLTANYVKFFHHQINFVQLGCSSLIEALSKLPNIKVRVGNQRVGVGQFVVMG